MAKECIIATYSVFNDRGSSVRELSAKVELDASAIIPGREFPQWPFPQDAPVVKYFDGETIVVSYRDRESRCIAGGLGTEVFSAVCPENIYVQESVSVCISLSAFSPDVCCTDFRSMYLYGSFNALVANALPLLERNRDAMVYFLRTVTSYSNMFLLDGTLVKMLEEKAAAGDPYSMFAMGRYLICTQKDDDAPFRAEQYFKAAYAKGLPEAAVGLSQILARGECGELDRDRAEELLAEALRKGCGFATEVHLKNMIFGMPGVSGDLEQAERMLDTLIASEAGDVNPMWYYLRACTLLRSSSLSAAKDDYGRAVTGGMISAWSDYAIASAHDDDFVLVDRNRYHELLGKGVQMRDSVSIFILAVSGVEDYDDMPAWKKSMERQFLIESLQKAVALGSGDAAEYLGNIYSNGWYDIPEDYEMAWECYEQGARLASAACMERMFDMAYRHLADVSTDYRDSIALKGARWGSEHLLNETVIAYTQGRLTGFADEIERYYVPVFDASGESDDEDGDEYPDDDGRYDAYV